MAQVSFMTEEAALNYLATRTGRDIRACFTDIMEAKANRPFYPHCSVSLVHPLERPTWTSILQVHANDRVETVRLSQLLAWTMKTHW